MGRIWLQVETSMEPQELRVRTLAIDGVGSVGVCDPTASHTDCYKCGGSGRDKGLDEKCDVCRGVGNITYIEPDAFELAQETCGEAIREVQRLYAEFGKVIDKLEEA